jgi:hypothetical protein
MRRRIFGWYVLFGMTLSLKSIRLVHKVTQSDLSDMDIMPPDYTAKVRNLTGDFELIGIFVPGTFAIRHRDSQYTRFINLTIYPDSL